MTAQAFAPSSHPSGDDKWRRRNHRERVLKVEYWRDDVDPEEGVDPNGAELAPKWLHDVEKSVNDAMQVLSSAGHSVAYDAVVSCFQLLGRVMDVDTIAPIVVPRFDGGFQLEWHVNDVDLEISVAADGTRSAWCEHASGREWEDEEVHLNVGRLRKELSLLTHDG